MYRIVVLLDFRCGKRGGGPPESHSRPLGPYSPTPLRISFVISTLPTVSRLCLLGLRKTMLSAPACGSVTCPWSFVGLSKYPLKRCSSWMLYTSLYTLASPWGGQSKLLGSWSVVGDAAANGRKSLKQILFSGCAGRSLGLSGSLADHGECFDLG